MLLSIKWNKIFDLVKTIILFVVCLIIISTFLKLAGCSIIHYFVADYSGVEYYDEILKKIFSIRGQLYYHGNLIERMYVGIGLGYLGNLIQLIIFILSIKYIINVIQSFIDFWIE